MGKNQAGFGSPRQADVDHGSGLGLKTCPAWTTSMAPPWVRVPYPHVVAGIAVRQAGLTENGVLKANLGIMFRAGFKQAILDAAEGFKRFEEWAEYGEVAGKQVAGDSPALPA